MAKTTTRKKTATKKTWMVMSVPCAGGDLWTAYKLNDETLPDEESNRIKAGGFWSTKKEAESLAKKWNEVGKE